MRKGLFFFVLLSVIPGEPARAQETSPRQAKIIELMDLTGAKSMGDQIGQIFIQQMSATMQQTSPNIPKRAHEIIRDVTIEVLKGHSAELLARMVPLYEKHFTESEIDELLAFYRSPTGKKAIDAMPKLMQEAAPLSEEWALGLRPELQQRLKERLAAEKLIP